MIEIQRTDVFSSWFDRLRDREAKTRIIARIVRLELGNPGDVKSIGDGVSEMRIAHGPGYRVYFAWRGQTLVILLCGGDKSSQSRDIAMAKTILRDIGD